MAKQKYYVVWEGRKPGIFTSWKECSAQVTGYPNAQYKSFENKQAAEEAFRGQYKDYEGKRIPNLSQQQLFDIGRPILTSYSVDASCVGNPGILEYRCVHTETRQEIFRRGPFEQGTNNVGEFLGIVEALARFKKEGVSLPIYTDSEIAIGWVTDKKCNTNLKRDERNPELLVVVTF